MWIRSVPIPLKDCISRFDIRKRKNGLDERRGLWSARYWNYQWLFFYLPVFLLFQPASIQAQSNSTRDYLYLNGRLLAIEETSLLPTTPPGAFSKSAPSNGATGQATSLTVSWGSSSGAVGYEYCYDTSNNSACNSAWVSTGTSTSTSLSGLSPNVLYYWQVRASNANGTTEADSGTWWSFRVQSLAQDQNYALSGTVSQSSTLSGAVAARAIDNNTDGNWANNSITHASADAEAWWHVDLGSVRWINYLQLWNRSDCCSSRLSNFYVFVSDVPFTSTSLSATMAQSGVSNYYTSGEGGYPTTKTIGRTGRYVRVQLAATDYLSLAEVKVWGGSSGVTPPGSFNKSSPANGATGQTTSPTLTWGSSSGATSYEYCYDTSNNNGCNSSWVSAGTSLNVTLSGLSGSTTYYWQVRGVNTGGVTEANSGTWWSFQTQSQSTNWALSGTATQSSTLSPAVAGRAIDNNTDGNWANNSITHTYADAEAWWHVDLGSVRSIASIQLWNRTDCCSNRLSNFYVFVSDVPFTSTSVSATIAQSGVSNYFTSGEGGYPTTKTIGRTGRYVRVQLAATDYLSLAEVKVWGP